MKERRKKQANRDGKDAATEEQRHNRGQSINGNSALLAQPSSGCANQQTEQCRNHGAAAQQAAQILPAMNALGEYSENAACLALRLQRRDGDHGGKENGIAGVPAQEEEYLVALRVDAIDTADSQHVRAHHGKRDPLRANKVDADEEYGAHETNVSGQRKPAMCRPRQSRIPAQRPQNRYCWCAREWTSTPRCL